jgi:hypothetical protein
MPDKLIEIDDGKNGDWLRISPIDIGSIQVFDRDGQPLGDVIELSDVINLPDIADVQFPSMIGAIPAKKKKRKPYKYRGVQLSRKPMKFEHKVLSLAEIPKQLDATVQALVTLGLANLRSEMIATAEYGAHEVLRELVRQGARADLMDLNVPIDINPLWEAVAHDRSMELSSVRSGIEHRLSQRRITGSRLAEWTDDLLGRRTPAMEKRYAARAVNEAFTFGRQCAINMFHRRATAFNLAGIRNDEGKFISIVDAVNEGYILVDAVVQTAVMDTYTCDECEAVDGEVMDLGDARQIALHPPYVKCYGGDRCRCVQIALLDNGMEIEVDEIDEDTID